MDVISILWVRQMKRYVRSRSRLFGAVGQPLLFLLALGYGLGSVYKKAGAGNYLQFLVPGIITQTILFSAVFWGIIILFDKRFGFLKELLVAPVSRFRILVGSALGGATITMTQALLVLIISVCIGFRPHNWLGVGAAIIVMLVMSLALTSFGAGIASMVEDFQGFQAINNFLIFPLFFLSSALYPLTNAPEFLKFLAAINPITYCVDALRFFFIDQSHFSIYLDLAVIVATLIVSIVFAVNRFNRLQV